MPGPPSPPKSVVNAVGLMYAGAAGFPLTVLIWALSGTAGSGFWLFVPPVTALWLWMAVMNKRGRSWARIVSTVSFAGYCLSWFVLLFPLILGYGMTDPQDRPRVSIWGWMAFFAPIAGGWIIGLVTIVLLWQSSEFYGHIKHYRKHYALHERPAASSVTPRRSP